MLRTRRFGLPALFFGAMLLPALALAWLGWQLIEQDRSLERQRVQDLVDSTANRVTAAVEREVGALERNLGSAVHTIRINRDGTLAGGGQPPLIFEPATPPSPAEPAPSVWTDAERLEFGGNDPSSSIGAYRALSRSADRGVRAGALVRLARVLRRAGRNDEALDVYSSLVSTPATVGGDPADLMARAARVDLLASLERHDAARAEAAALDTDLAAGRWRLERTTALTYLNDLARWRSAADASVLAGRLRTADAVAAVWDGWRSATSASPTDGRRTIRAGDDDVLVVWRGSGDALMVHAAAASALFEAWQHLWTSPAIAVAFEDASGHVVAGSVAPASTVSIVRPASDTRLPWTLRVSATSTPPEIAATGTARRRFVLAVVVLLAILIVAAGILVARTVNRELALARQQSQFVAAVSHEFRSPLTSLSHLTSLLRSDFQPTEARRRQYYDMLAAETDRLRRFVETLLDFGRMQAGASRYRLEPTDIAAVVNEVVDDFRRHPSSAGRDIRCHAVDDLPTVSADANALGRAFWNLLENAAKYSAEHEPIEVGIALQDGRVVIRVTDRGAGIADAEQPFIYDQFYRGAAAIASAVKGTGVGLAFVRHIVLAHGGEIRCTSRVGAGSTFTILLPPLADADIASDARRVS